MSKETREIADRVARSFGFDKDGFVTCDPAALINAIDDALRDRDERAAKIAEQHEGHGGWCASACGDCQSLTVKAIATAIRNGVANAK